MSLRRLRDELLFLLPFLAALLVGSAALHLRVFVRDHVDPETLPAWIPNPTIEDGSMEATEEPREDSFAPDSGGEVEIPDEEEIDEDGVQTVRQEQEFALFPVEDVPQIKKALRFVTVEGQEDRHMHVIVALSQSIEKLTGAYGGGEGGIADLISEIAAEASSRAKLVAALRVKPVLDEVGEKI